MSPDLYEQMMARVKELRRDADQLEEAARRERQRQAPTVLLSGKMVKKPAGWKTADSIEQILVSGPLAEDDLLATLAREKRVEGDAWDDKISNGRKAITAGVNKGYLAREDGRVRWIPGVRQNRRLRQKTPAP